MDWFVSALKKYAVFSGRSQRAEYWYFMLFYVLISLIVGFLDGIAGTTIGPQGQTGLISFALLLAMLLPSLAVSVRRLHDIGRSGWWLLIGFVPLIGMLVLLVFAARDSEPGDNRFGPNPKPVGAL
jgi:uncharacterized membrane protein YhaH (DUF805 family)